MSMIVDEIGVRTVARYILDDLQEEGDCPPSLLIGRVRQLLWKLAGADGYRLYQSADFIVGLLLDDLTQMEMKAGGGDGVKATTGDAS